VCEFPPICHSTGSAIKIQSSSIADFRSLVRLFTEKNWEYFTYQLPEDKKCFLVLRGLPADTPIEDICASLEEKNLAAENIVQLRTSRPTKKQQEERVEILATNPDATLPSLPPRCLPLFQIKLYDASDKPAFEAVTNLCGLTVTIETFKPSTGHPQCKKCQRYGHTAKTCGMQTRCVRCGEGHSHKECEVAKPAPATCANCNGNHPANFRGCPAYRSYAERLNAARRPTATQPAPSLTSATNFPSLPTPAPTPAPLQPSLQATISSFLTPSIKSKLISWLSNLIQKLITPSDKSKSDIILEEIIQAALLFINNE
jgi:hypothetical protein